MNNNCMQGIVDANLDKGRRGKLNVVEGKRYFFLLVWHEVKIIGLVQKSSRSPQIIINCADFHPVTRFHLAVIIIVTECFMKTSLILISLLLI